jgi:hypothetical protein
MYDMCEGFMLCSVLSQTHSSGLTFYPVHTGCEIRFDVWITVTCIQGFQARALKDAQRAIWGALKV